MGAKGLEWFLLSSLFFRYSFEFHPSSALLIVAAYADVSQEGTASILASFHDITSDRLRIASLINDCNRLKISIIHFGDVIENFLAN